MPYLQLKWSLSKASDTYGYNRVTLTDMSTKEKFVACGGGYDMIGTVLAQWLCTNRQTELLTVAHRGRNYPGNEETKNLCGLTYCSGEQKKGLPAKPYMYVDGAYGREAVICIAAACGVTIKEKYSEPNRLRNVHLTHFYAD